MRGERKVKAKYFQKERTLKSGLQSRWPPKRVTVNDIFNVLVFNSHTLAPNSKQKLQVELPSARFFPEYYKSFNTINRVRTAP